MLSLLYQHLTVQQCPTKQPTVCNAYSNSKQKFILLKTMRVHSWWELTKGLFLTLKQDGRSDTVVLSIEYPDFEQDENCVV